MKDVFTATFDLEKVLDTLRPQLPIQNPMPFFVHNNPLQYWEKFPFDEGITASCLLYERAGIKLDRNFTREFEDIVIPVLSSYLDQGLRRWNDVTEDSLWEWFRNFVEHSFQFKSESFYKVKNDSAQWASKSAKEVIVEILDKKYSNASDKYFYIKSLLFHFKGWSGMVHLLESNPALFPLQQKSVSLVDWLAILILVEAKINPSTLDLDSEKRFLRQQAINTHLNTIKNKEISFYKSVLSQLKERISKRKIAEKTAAQDAKPLAQIFFCIDDREESFRRILEQINPKIETLGTVGFFGIDVAIKSFNQLIFQPFCPPVIKPRKKAIEKAKHSSSSLRHFFTYFNHTRFTLFEPLLILLGPLFYLISLSVRSSHPGFYYRLKNRILKSPAKDNGYEYAFLPGLSYSTPEKAQIVRDILKSAGLKNNFAPIVMMMAHGASTTNNPFQKSYGCGACSGQSGFPNAKFFCQFANEVDVRNELKKSGYVIPDETLFIAAHHDTCSDQIHIADTKLDKQQEFILNQLKSDFDEALEQNTRLRFKRFGVNPNDSAVQRSLDWSQPRPEYGHSNVALAIFGPRYLTNGLDLDRRAFLVSYDPTSDEDGSELEYVILNALPVCANINLDYFTSRAFPDAFGSGSKLPMNVASGIGLMTGSKSDLKIGLAKQMVDQHEALRLLSFVFCERDHLLKIVSSSPRLNNLINNEWIHLVRIDPKDFSIEPLTKEISNAIN